jgi:SPP1 family predicted phage head-tail adaptor
MNPGSLKQKLIFQFEGESVDSDGFPVAGTIDYTTARAKLKTLKGRTFYSAAQTNLEHSREFTIRYQNKLDDELRPAELYVLWKDKKHEIVSIENDDGLGVSMTVVVKAVT